MVERDMQMYAESVLLRWHSLGFLRAGFGRATKLDPVKLSAINKPEWVILCCSCGVFGRESRAFSLNGKMTAAESADSDWRRFRCQVFQARSILSELLLK
jgi:hypothetical protein